MLSKTEDYKSKGSEEILKELGPNKSIGLCAEEARPFSKTLGPHSLDIEVAAISLKRINLQ